MCAAPIRGGGCGTPFRVFGVGSIRGPLLSGARVTGVLARARGYGPGGPWLAGGGRGLGSRSGCYGRCSMVVRGVLARFGGAWLSYGGGGSAVRLRPPGCPRWVFLGGEGGPGSVACRVLSQDVPHSFVPGCRGGGGSRGPFGLGQRHQPGGYGCWGVAAWAGRSLSSSGISVWFA